MLQSRPSPIVISSGDNWTMGPRGSIKIIFTNERTQNVWSERQVDGTALSIVVTRLSLVANRHCHVGNSSARIRSQGVSFSCNNRNEFNNDNEENSRAFMKLGRDTNGNDNKNVSQESSKVVSHQIVLIFVVWG